MDNIDEFLNELYENWIDMVIENIPLVQNFNNNYNQEQFSNERINIYQNSYNRNTENNNDTNSLDILHFFRGTGIVDNNILHNSNTQIINNFIDIANQRSQINESSTISNTHNNTSNTNRLLNVIGSEYNRNNNTVSGRYPDLSLLLGDLVNNIFNYIDHDIYEDVKVTISQNDFDKLKDLLLNDNNIDDYKEKICNICLDNYNINDKLKILPCNHYFHENCIHTWLCNTKVNCPICRKDIRET
jgi:hypothetical protein